MKIEECAANIMCLFFVAKSYNPVLCIKVCPLCYFRECRKTFWGKQTNSLKTQTSKEST